MRRVRVVVAAAPGVATGSLPAIRADQESRLILEAQALGHLDVELRSVATIDDLAFSGLRPPDIFHLICQGDRGTLVFVDECGDPRRFAAIDVAELIGSYGVHLSGIVLNACHSEGCAETFAPLADTVIAHKGPLDDDCARLFAGRLYRTLQDFPDLAHAARISADHLATGEACRSGIRAGLVVLRNGGGR